MIIAKSVDVSQSNTEQQGGVLQNSVVLGAVLFGLAGCSSITSTLESGRLDYKSAATKPTASLEVPPDLTQLQRESRYTLPVANKGVVNASVFDAQQTQQSERAGAVTSAVVVAANTKAKESDLIRVEREGNQRWLVVKRSPEVLWPQIKDFWQDAGFVINTESFATGVMETDWAENRAKIPQDVLRKTLGKIVDSLYSTGERDKFRTRLELTADGATEIYISHRGVEEVLVGSNKETTMWTARPTDPQLEAEILSRLMVRLGVDGERAKNAVGQVVSQPERAKLVKDAAGSYVSVDENFERAWRRVGLALDRAGFTVEDRDRAQGVYFVRYVEQEQDAKAKAASEKGFLSRLFSSDSSNDKMKAAQRYRILLKKSGASDAGNANDVNNVATKITVLNGAGQVESSSNVDKILSLLNEQLK